MVPNEPSGDSQELRSLVHDLRNPLQVIIGRSQNLASLLDQALKKEIEIDTNGLRQRVISDTGHILEALASMHELAFPSHGTSGADMNSLVQRVCSMLSLNDTYKYDCMYANASFPVTMKRGELTRVAFNLLVNAQEAMPQGGTITVKTDFGNVYNPLPVRNGIAVVSPGLYGTLTITDQGTGISPDVLPQMFVPNFSTKNRGSGLGLDIVLGLVKQAGGEIDVLSQVGEGSTFRVYIPVQAGYSQPQNQVAGNPSN